MLLAHLTDLHLRPAGKAAYRVVETNMLAERALRAVARLRPSPDVLIISGDLAYDGQPGEYAVLRRLLARYINVPVYVVPGNHDDRAAMKASLGFLPGVAAEADFVHYTVDDLPVRLVMLDTIVPGAPEGRLCEARLAFLERALAEAPDRPTVVVMHHPPFACGIEHMDGINLRNSAEFAAVIARHRHVELILCGHHHRHITARLAGAVCHIGPATGHQVELALEPGARGMFVMEPSAFLLHRWTPADGFVSHLAYVEDFPGPYPFVPGPD